jgi:Tfp pilus assembly PilM family ATPase
MPVFSSPFSGRLLPLLGERLVVIDPGSRCLKLLVVESMLGRTRLVHRQSIDLQEEGLLEPEELHQHLETLMPKLGRHSIAVVLPQHRCIAQLIEVPVTTVAEENKLVEAEVVKLSGLPESAMLYDAARVKPFGSHQHPCWLTFCRAAEVFEQLNRFARPATAAADAFTEGRLTEMATTAQGLFAASQVIHPKPANAVLVDLGANNTVVAILVHAQGVFATSFPLGGNQFTEALAKLQNCPIEEAEAMKRSRNLLVGQHAVAGFDKALEKWHGELRQAVAEWLEDNPELKLSLATLPVYLCGGGALQAGLLDFLNSLSQLRFESWPGGLDEDDDWPMEQYWVAYGVGLQALGKHQRPVSLLPADLRAARRRDRFWQRLQSVNVLLLLAVFLLLAVGTWQKAALLSRKVKLIAQTEAALGTARSLDLLSRRLNAEYEQVRPILLRQQQTAETLQTLAALQEVRTNRDFWFVLFADQASYFAGSAMPAAATNQTNVAFTPAPTNATPPRREFIAELCIPREGDETRRILSQVVSELGRHPLFARVDVLPQERRRSLVDPKVVITNRFFAVAIELGGKAPPPPLPAAQKPLPPPPRREPRRTAQPPRPKAEGAPAPAAQTNR